MTSTTTEIALAMEMPWWILRAEMALDSGIFSNDPHARAQAESDLAHAKRFCSEVFSEAYSNPTTPLPTRQDLLRTRNETAR